MIIEFPIRTFKNPESAVNLDYTGSTFTSQETEDLLVSLMQAGSSNGSLTLDDAAEPPGAAGMAALGVLVDRGWTINCAFALVLGPTFTVNIDGTWQMTVVANGFGDSVTYQWQVLQREGEHQEGPGFEWVDVGGQTTATYNNPPVNGITTFENGQSTIYRCAVTRNAVVSYSVGAPTLAPYVDNIIQPNGGTFVTDDDLEMIVATAQATGGTYQWQKDGVDLDGKTGSVTDGEGITLTIPTASEDDAGDYTIVITAENGAKVTSNPATFTFVG